MTRAGATGGLTPSSRAFLGATFAAGAAAIAVAIALLGSAAPPTPSAGIAAFALLAATFLLQRRGLVVHWRGQRVATTFDEPTLFLALLLLPAPAAVIVVTAGAAFSQLVARRSGVKAAYNVAQHALASGSGALAFTALASRGVDPLLAGAAAVAAYTLVAYALVSTLFARLENVPALRTYRERFAAATVVNIVFGVGLVVALVALWRVHPVATLAMAPFALVAWRFGRMTARVEREALVRRQLARVTTSIATVSDVDTVADNIVRECGDLFLAGKVVLELRADVARDRRVWEHEFEGGPAANAVPLEAPIVGRSGAMLGSIRVFPAQRAPAARNAHLDQPLLDLIAAEAAIALDVALAIRELVALENVHESMVRHMPAGVLRVDAQGNVEQANDYFERRIGAPSAAWPLLSAHPRVAEVLARLQRGEAAALPGVRVEERTYDLAGVPLHDERGAPAGGILLFQEVTSRILAEEAERRHSITRPLVRRIVLDLVHNSGASAAVIAAVGRRLAREVDGPDVERFVLAFRHMGLGELAFSGVAGETYTFAADDLLERRERTREPTCHLARGFLEGIVGHLHGSEALCSEVQCQSRGDAQCVFMVQPRAPIVTQRRRVAHAAK